MDGLDLRSVSVAELRSRIRLTFQTSVNYHSTARENIVLGSLQENPTDEDIQNAAWSAGADEVIAHLPQTYDTILGKGWADGTELSGGEWQRVANARAFVRKGDILLLDEPTSMMDSWSEADWFDRFRLIAAGRTAVIITHRLSIAMRAHLIYVMMKGKLIECGSHQELLASGGHYARRGICKPNVAAAVLSLGRKLRRCEPRKLFKIHWQSPLPASRSMARSTVFSARGRVHSKLRRKTPISRHFGFDRKFLSTAITSKDFSPATPGY
jgi:ABC-type phosphate transport system ATPase subunit